MTYDIDWRQLWIDEQGARRAPDDSAYWDRRAPSFQATAGTSPYAATFLERVALQPGETVFDMGCGSGTLALPLAAAGYDVYAADFSQVMLDLMMQRAELEGYADRIHAQRVAWGDDWDAADVPVCDVALASRSISTDDLWAALQKLDSRARNRVCITLGTTQSPRSDPVITAAIGRAAPRRPDYVFATHMLLDMGKRPSLSYIESARDTTYETVEAAVEKYALIYNVDSAERERLEAYCAEHMSLRDTEEGARWAFDHRRRVTWAFISWDK